MQFGTRARLLYQILKNGVEKDPHRHSVHLSEVLEIDVLVCPEKRICIFEPQLGVVAEIADDDDHHHHQPIDAKRFFVRDNSRSGARSLSSNHSLRATTVYVSTEVGA